MGKQHGVQPDTQHGTCIVDGLGRAGRIEEAERFAREVMPCTDIVVWRTLLGACRGYKGQLTSRMVEIAKYAAQRIWAIDPNDAASYELLANIHANMGNRKDKAMVRELMETMRVKKSPGRTLIEVNGMSYSFTVGQE